MRRLVVEMIWGVRDIHYLGIKVFVGEEGPIPPHGNGVAITTFGGLGEILADVSYHSDYLCGSKLLRHCYSEPPGKQSFRAGIDCGSDDDHCNYCSVSPLLRSEDISFSIEGG